MKSLYLLVGFLLSTLSLEGKPHHYVLVSGAWHGPECWKLLEKKLKDLGHTVSCVEFPGTGASCQVPIEEITYESYKQAVAKAVESGECILVAHSMSGMVAGPLSDELGDKISRVFFVCAYLPTDGISMREQATIYRNPDLLTVFIQSPDRLALIPTRGAEMYFYNASTPEIREQAFRATYAQAIAPMREKVWWNPIPDQKRFYIACGKDRMLPYVSQIAIAKRVVLPEQILTLPDADHFPQLSQVDTLVHILTSANPL